ncbi:MAG TPA: hypothetical protein PL182_00190 [Pseudobdellovibrionaceae bacterium]|nr:hypothetical protein [Pseudobdellovibrionaceae bacterium]
MRASGESCWPKRYSIILTTQNPFQVPYMVDQLSPKTNTASSINLKMISHICTGPLYRKEEWLKQKYLAEKLPVRQIAVLIGCSHHAVNNTLKKFGMKRDIASRGRLGFEVRWCPKGRIVPRKLKTLISWMAKLRTGLELSRNCRPA